MSKDKLSYNCDRIAHLRLVQTQVAIHRQLHDKDEKIDWIGIVGAIGGWFRQQQQVFPAAIAYT